MTSWPERTLRDFLVAPLSCTACLMLGLTLALESSCLPGQLRYIIHFLHAADWCHAWSILGQWSGLVTFPVPVTGQWPRHGHLRGILDGFQGRQPNFISGPGPPMSKGPCQHSAFSQAKLWLRCYQETRFIRPWKLNRASWGLPYCMGCGSFLGQQSGSRSGSTTTFSSYRPACPCEDSTVPALIPATSGAARFVGTKPCNWDSV